MASNPAPTPPADSVPEGALLEQEPWREAGVATRSPDASGPPPTPVPPPEAAAPPSAGPEQGAGGRADPPVATGRARRWWDRSHAALLLLMVAAAVGYFVVSWMRYQEFYDTNWDLGIGMQALWSTTHGSLLYEAGDRETYGLNSLLSVHSTYIAIPIAYLYALAPGAATLFALQSTVVASSAIPLYLIGRKAGLPDRWLVPGLAVYLLTFTVSSAVLYDFHWEAFLPAEFAWTYYLWAQRRYALAFVPAVVGVLTLEVFPFLLLGLVLCFAYPGFQRFVMEPTGSLRAVFGDLRRYLRRATPLLGLLAFSLVSYVVIRVVQHNVIPRIVGTAPSPLNAQLSQGYTQLFGVTATAVTLPPSLIYWFLLFAAFGFIPFLVRQSLLLMSVPWFYASVFVAPHYSAGFGNQYAFVAVATIAVAFIEGLAAVYRSASQAEAPAPLPLEWLLVVVPFCLVALLFSPQLLGATHTAEILLLVVGLVVVGVLVLLFLSREQPQLRSKSVWRHTYSMRDPTLRASYRQSTRVEVQSARTTRPPRVVGLTRFRPRTALLLAGVLVIVLVSNLAMSPFSPTNFKATVYPGYRFSFSTSPAYADISQALAALPAQATVLASDNLFPFVANDVHAYSLYFGVDQVPYLPFNAEHLPPYVFLSTNEWSAVPPFLKSTVFDGAVYGILSMVYDPSYPDTIYLLETGYQGPATLLEVTPFPDTMTVCPSAFNLGPSGRVIPDPGTPCGSEIESIPTVSGTNEHSVWFGPYITLLPGQYNVTMSLRGGLYAGKPATSQIVYLDGSGYGTNGSWYAFNLDAAQLSADSWTNVTIHLNLTRPVSGAEFRGYLDYTGATKPADTNGYVDLSCIQVVRTGAPA